MSVIRRAPQVGQKPRRLQLNATSFSGRAPTFYDYRVEVANQN